MTVTEAARILGRHVQTIRELTRGPDRLAEPVRYGKHNTITHGEVRSICRSRGWEIPAFFQRKAGASS